MSGLTAPWRRRGDIAALRGRRTSASVAAAILVASSGGFWLYIRIAREQQAVRRRKLRAQLRSAAMKCDAAAMVDDE